MSDTKNDNSVDNGTTIDESEKNTMTTDNTDSTVDNTVDNTGAAEATDVAQNVAEHAAESDKATADADTTDAAAQNVQFSIVFDDDDDDADASENASADDDETIAVDIANVSETLASAVNATDRADGTNDDVDVDADKSDDTIADGANDSVDATIGDVAGVAAANAARVNETLALGKKQDATSQAIAEADHANAAGGASADDQSLRLSVRLDKELKAGREDDKLLKAYPSLALNKVTLTDRKSGHNTLDRVSASFYKGHLYAIRVDGDDERVALLGLVTGLTRPTDGAVMNKSLNVLEIDPGELLGHRFGLIPQRYAVRDDLNAEQNVLYAMDASGRTFLKPKPVLARELLMRVGFDADTPNVPAGKLPEVQKRLVAIARAISCDAEVIIADEPTGGLDADDSVTVLKTLLSLTRGDDKRCVVVLTSDDEVAEVAEHVTYLSE
ncbi:ATP-binding cassette domain-containing protein [Bifidobacterium amazonense]|uniref:ATP-binding cassette domain-containing protein n=1 Tax=Bifidobacterium amazonense TaxID=2809027 RepID=A0ABS9VUF9_9BIFI|nr:ATP-binding cassette domain-containing protein [Bifidobacterium amazonense]MCH9275450.1 ATP-binding cassette domain-containing protein [Bifidobacterium amazonense]